MLGFLSAKKGMKSIVKKNRIFFVSIPDNISDEEIKMLISPKAKLFANKLNVKNVYLHFGKENIIAYDFKI